MAEEQIYDSNSEKEQEEDEVIVVEFRIYMHCTACERTVAKAISKIDGVVKFTTDMENDRVVVMGKFDPAKVQKKLRKKIGKRVDIVENEDDDPENNGGNGDQSPATSGHDIVPPLSVTTMFSDENPNACSIL